MRKSIHLQAPNLPRRFPPCNLRPRSIYFAVPLLAALAWLGIPAAAQTPASPHPAPPAHKTVHARPAKADAKTAKPAHKTTHARPANARTKAAAATKAAAEAEKPKPPEAPKWPANDQPAEASVVWDSQGLSISASNSSLQQILKDVETATGAEVEGLGDDQRVFGVYGPGLARDVLSQLLQGSGYNVLMIGDLGKGAPRQIVLSTRNAADAKTVAKPAGNSDEDSAETDPEEPQPQPVQPVRPAFGPGGPPRTPQQIMQEMQQRQQQQQQQGTPPRPQ